jgi:hypothetical protein
MDELIDGHWMRLSVMALKSGYTDDVLRGLAQRGQLEATMNERGFLLIAAKELQRLRLWKAVEKERMAISRIAGNATFNDGNGRTLVDYAEISRRIDAMILDHMRQKFPTLSDDQLLGTRDAR